MPSIDSDLLFYIAIGPAIFVAVIVHEAGHVLAARYIGQEIAAWGVGCRRPWFHRRIGRPTFYLGFPLTGGLTIPVPSTLERNPIQQFVMILGGPLATSMGLAIGLAVHACGMESDALSAWIYVSAFFLLCTIVPYKYTSHSLRLASDGAQLIRNMSPNRENDNVPVGPSLAGIQAIIKLLEDIACDEGLCCYHSIAAAIQAALGDVVGAKANLVQVRSHTASCALSHFADATIAFTENSSDAENKFRLASEMCCRDATAKFALACMYAEWRFRRGQDNLGLTQSLHKEAIDASRRDWQCWCEQLLFEAKVEGDVEAECRRILSEFRQQIGDVSRARMLAITAERLASQGATDRAQALFTEATVATAKVAASIVSLGTREAYLLSAGTLLGEVAQRLNIPAPSFDSISSGTYDSRRRICAFLSLALSVPGLVLSICGAAAAFDFIGGGPRIAMGLQAIAVLTAMIAFGAIAISILRSEHRRWRTLSVSLTLLIFVISGFCASQFQP